MTDISVLASALVEDDSDLYLIAAEYGYTVKKEGTLYRLEGPEDTYNSLRKELLHGFSLGSTRPLRSSRSEQKDRP